MFSRMGPYCSSVGLSIKSNHSSTPLVATWSKIRSDFDSSQIESQRESQGFSLVYFSNNISTL